MRRMLIACTLLVLAWTGAWPGVVIEMEDKNPDTGASAPIDTIYAQGEMLRMDSSARGSGRMSIIFRDDTLWMVNHDEKSCQTIDKEGMEQLSAQLGGVMKQMEAELAKLPPEQRAMMEEMMKSKMPAGMAGAGTAGPPRRIEVGAVEKVGEYSCTLHTLFAGDDKVWEICAAPEKALPAATSEALGAFRAMSRFAEQLRDALQQGPLADMIATPFNELTEVNGLPIRVRSFDRGQITNESILKSIASQELDAGVFNVPDGYAVKDLTEGMKAGR